MTGLRLAALVGYSAGVGYDIYARTLARYMGRHIPGHPTLVTQNMPGAGSVKAANYLYNVAPKDGTVFGLEVHSVGGAEVEGLVEEL